MRLKEQRLWDRMKSNIGGSKDLWLNRIENRVGVGDPDVEALARGGFYSKVELKAVHEAPKRATTPLLGDEGLSTEQKNFHYKWNKLGGRSFILIGIGKGRSAEQYLVRGISADTINDWTLEELKKFSLAQTWSSVSYTLRGFA